ncbi:high-affinity branched-chain amino acid ABC transporter permease LivM [Pelagibacteraceae bacterium]|nr:high-affinity branched-chain amino acid ABC transporter permease LivM [Pelagibacteraceae bacterium]MDC1158734.1 high-affinity branched-chain amino acid ABC transporter permease LivM [Pelagibacteraceae bacterium]
MSSDIRAIVKDSLFTGLISLALFGPIVGLKTFSKGAGLFVTPHWTPVIFLVLACTIGRFLIGLNSLRKKEIGFVSKITSKLSHHMDNKGKHFAITGVLFAVVFPFLPFTDRYILDVSIMILTYIMLGWGLNIVVGLAGLLDLGYVAFYAVGAYSYALIATTFGWSFWVCLPLAGVFAAFFGILLGFPVLRLRGDYLAIVTLGFGEIIRIVLINWYEVTNGPDGITGIPRPTFFGLPFKKIVEDGENSFHTFFNLEYSTMHRIIFLYYLILVLALITNYFTLKIRKLPVGRAWEALREDEIACKSLGVNPTNTKLTAFAIGATFGGFAGAFFATRQAFVSPESFTFIESAIIVAIVVLGGMGSQTGVVLASIFLIGITEMFRDLEQYRMIAFGGAMVLIMVFKPKGILANRKPTITLREHNSK